MSEIPHSPVGQRIACDLDNLRQQCQLRSLEISSGINLISNDYLGLARDPRLKEAVLDGLARSGSVGATGSRLLSGNSAEWEAIESDFAAFTGAEAALFFGSGYAANTGLLSSIAKPGDVVFSDALNHASLIDGIRLSGAQKVIYPHRDMEFLEQALRERAGAAGAKIIVTESIFSMEGDVAPLEQVVGLARRYGADIVLDEAHAIGVRGPKGRGIAAELGCESEIFATVYTCGKALASAGACVCGSAALKQYLINCARTFIFSTAMPPYFAHQIRAAMDLARAADDRRAHLQQLSRALRTELSGAGLSFAESTTHIVPVLLGANDTALRVAAEVRAAGFAVRAIRPPTVPPGTARLRISLTANISMPDIHRLGSAIAAAHKHLEPSPASAHA